MLTLLAALIALVNGATSITVPSADVTAIYSENSGKTIAALVEYASPSCFDPESCYVIVFADLTIEVGN